MKKISSVSVFLLAASALVLFGPVARADSDNSDNNNDNIHFSSDQPRLYSDITTTKTSAVLNFRDRKFADETVRVIVSIKKDEASENLIEKAYNVKLDGEGNGKVTVKGLKAGTDYSFKVRIMRMGSNRSTQNSSEESATTM